jgi:hypothetical protein
MCRFAFPLLLAAILPCQPAAAIEHRHHSTMRKARLNLAVGAALMTPAGYGYGYGWPGWRTRGAGLPGRMTADCLFPTRSRSRPEPEADHLNTAKHFIGPLPFPQRTWHAELRLDY